VNVELEINQDVAPPGALMVPASNARLLLAGIIIPEHLSSLRVTSLGLFQSILAVFHDDL
jgi:hypothetical protein